MSLPGFVHLHVHGEMSYMDGHAKIPDIVRKTVANRQNAVALTDHGTLAGSWKFAQECRKHGVKPILGMEAYLAIGRASEQNSVRIPGDDGALREKRYHHLTLLAQNHTGWLNLIQLHDKAHDYYWYKPRIDYGLLERYSEGVVCLTGCLAGPVTGPLAQAVNQTSEQARLLETAIVRAYEVEADSHEVLVAEANRWLAARNQTTIETPTDGDLERTVHEALTVWSASRENPDPTPLKTAWDTNQAHHETIQNLEARTARNLHKQAEESLTRLKHIYGPERLFVEIMEHGIPQEQAALPHLVNMAEKHGVRCVATNDPHYCSESDAVSHDAWIALTTAKTGQAALNTPGRFRFNGEGYWLKTETEMRAARPESWWQQACDNTTLVAEMVDDNVLGETRMRLPQYPTSPDTTPDQQLAKLIKQGSETKYGTNPDTGVKQRLNREYNIIRRLGLSSYFLIVQDFITWARSDYTPTDWITHHTGGTPPANRERKKPILIGPGRGSAGGSAVAYVLDITRIDPIRHHLLFERFLDPTRVGMPDIDIDIEKNRLSEAHDYMRQRWGEHRVARIGSFQTMGPRACVKDAARLLGIPEKTANQITKTIPLVDGKWPTLESLNQENNPAGDGFRRQIAKLPPNQARQLIELASSFDGLTRGESIHASGMLISDIDINQIVPTRVNRDDPAGPRVTVWDGKDVEAAGLLKLDLLGLRNLDVINTTLDYIYSSTGETPAFPDPDEDTPETRKTWAMLKKGDTSGVFQLESSLAAEITMNMQPGCWADLTAINALNRPGPLAAGVDKKYAARRNGREPVNYDYLTSDPDETRSIAAVLDNTLGLIPYQETAMIVAREIAGFDPAAVNRLRKAISKKIREEFPALREAFIQGATSSITSEGQSKLAFAAGTAERLWEQIEGSAAYSFNASHSAAYALLSFYTAFLKANWPVEYAAALLAATDNTDKRRPLMLELASQGIPICPPDVNRSQVDTIPDNGRILLGLGEIKGIGTDIAANIVTAREQYGGKFPSLRDVASTPGVTSMQLTALIEAGALDEYGTRRGMSIIARIATRENIQIPDTEWAYPETYRRVVERLGIPLGDSPLKPLGREFLEWSDSLDIPAPLRSLNDVLGSPAGARLDVPAVVTRWQPLAKPYGTICALTLTNNTVSVNGWIWGKDYPEIARTGVNVGSVVRARVETRVRQFDTETIDGETGTQARVECTIRRLWIMPLNTVSRDLEPAPVGFLDLVGGGSPKAPHNETTSVAASGDTPTGTTPTPVETVLATVDMKSSQVDTKKALACTTPPPADTIKEKTITPAARIDTETLSTGNPNIGSPWTVTATSNNNSLWNHTPTPNTGDIWETTTGDTREETPDSVWRLAY